MQIFKGQLIPFHNGDFQSCIRKFEIIANTNDWLTPEKIKMIPLYLRDEAFDVYIDKSKTAYAYETICEYISKKFSENENFYKNKLSICKP